MQELYIGGSKADLSSATTIPITFTNISTDSPTAEHNPYSKTITLEGTPANNEIFSDAWSLSKNVTGDMYDARHRKEFKLYDNGNILMSGYVKLNKVNVNGNKVTYSITLYSSLGDFFYNLAYDENGDERTLASLRYWFKDASGNTMSLKDENEKPLFNWNASFITSGWSMGMDWDGSKSVYPIQVIKGAPTYRGHYDDFANDTVLINYDQLNTTDQGYIDDAFIRVPDQPILTRHYDQYKGWVVGKATRDLDEWEVRDLRSKFMRPAIPLKFVLSSIADGENNGGYQVTFDEDVINSPLYQKGWLIMDSIDFEDEASYNSLVDLVTHSGDTVISSTEDMLGGEAYLYNTNDEYNFNTSNMANPAVEMAIVGTVSTVRDMGEELYTARYLNLASSMAGYNYGAIYNGWHIRLDVYANDVKVGQSPDYFVHTESMSTAYPYNDNILGHIATKIGVDSLTDKVVKVTKDDTNYYVWDNPLVMKVDFSGSTNTSYKLVYDYVLYCPAVERGSVPESALRTASLFSSAPNFSGAPFAILGNFKNFDGGEDSIYITGYYDGTVNPNIQPMTVTKPMIFHTDHTPLDILLSFTKLTGCRYLVDDVDKKVTILPRSKYFLEGINEVIVDENEKEITPILTEYKWYEYGLSNADTYAAKLYRKKNALEYGHLKVNTTYQFNNDTENVFENVPLTNLIPYRLNSIYFNPLASSSTTIMMSPTVNVTAYYLSGSTLLDNGGINVYARAHYAKPFKVWDKIPKLCGFGDDNDNVDIGITIAVLDGFATDRISVSDNFEMQYYLNGDNPCYVWTETGSGVTDSSNTVKQANYLVDQWPLFSKYLTGSNGAYSFSLDFQKPAQTWLNDSQNYGDNITLYSKYHKEYINSIYHRNGEKVTLMANILEKPTVAARRVYRFGNSLWAISEIKEFVPNKDFCKVEFVKILSEQSLHQWGG